MRTPILMQGLSCRKRKLSQTVAVNPRKSREVSVQTLSKATLVHLRNLFGFFVSRNARQWVPSRQIPYGTGTLGPVVPHKAAEISIIGIYRRGELLWCMAERTKVAESISLSVSLSLSRSLYLSISLRLYLFVSLSICFFWRRVLLRMWFCFKNMQKKYCVLQRFLCFTRLGKW